MVARCGKLQLQPAFTWPPSAAGKPGTKSSARLWPTQQKKPAFGEAKVAHAATLLVALGLSNVQGTRCGAHSPRQVDFLRCGRWPLCSRPVGDPGAPELQALWCPMLLVPQ